MTRAEDPIEILDAMEQGILALNAQGEIEVFNASLERTCRLSRESTLGKSLADVFPAEEWLHQLYQRFLRHGNSVTLHDQNLSNHVPVSLTISPLWGQKDAVRGTVVGAVLVFQDLSLIKKVQEHFLKSDRLSYIGLVASGLAHEIKNPLTAIRGAAQLLAKEIPPGTESIQCCRVIVEETDRMNRLLEELLTLGRPHRIEVRPVNINQILDELILLESKSPTTRGIEFIKEFDPSLPYVPGDEARLKQVFLNLIRNAIEAMKERGTVRVRSKFATEYVTMDPGEKKKTHIIVEIEDNGPGIPEEEQEKIFIPFYTTKPKGTGLGLPLCLQIIEEHKGTIKAHSTPEKGTLFRIALPTSEFEGKFE
jgi:nitrogen-specific signal transduction histidine kinase